ncbi:MAG: DUF2793 domain-containing protein [Halopseudomonas sp.]|uniref:DUF2793 domain-containing protein n=1 Tax=Halopseudomonas sp. TaxID=2901191 RepID=UPI0030035271
MTTPNTGLPELANGQQNYLNANAAFAIIDALMQTAVISKTLTAAPGSPANGVLYIMASAWAGITGAAAGRLALYRTGSGWIVITPRTGWKKEVLADGLTYRYNGTTWLEWIASSSTSFAGITGTPSDNTALAAALDAKEDAVQDNLSASVPPTVDNDETEDYAPRSRWFDIVAGESYLCLSADDGAAVWVQTSLTLDELGSAALADVGTADAELPTNLTVMGKITAWWNGATSLFGRSFVASADAAAARTALELGTLALQNANSVSIGGGEAVLSSAGQPLTAIKTSGGGKVLELKKATDAASYFSIESGTDGSSFLPLFRSYSNVASQPALFLVGDTPDSSNTGTVALVRISGRRNGISQSVRPLLDVSRVNDPVFTINVDGSVVCVGPIKPGSFTVATLPTAPLTGAQAYATNGRKAGEGAGAGTGVPVYFQGSWKTYYDNTIVQA